MTLDKNTLDMLLKLPDDQLIMIIKGLAKEKGINLGDLNIGKEQLSALRRALAGADNADLARAAEILQGYKKK